MSQNRSSAVMNQRAEPHDSLDDFPTPPWAARAFCAHVLDPVKYNSVWDCAAGRGTMLRGLADYAPEVAGSDIFDYGASFPVHDFLLPYLPALRRRSDFIVTNPPFRLAEQFIARALSVARVGVAVLVRTSFAEGVGRYERLFSAIKPSVVAQYVERVPMFKGRLDPKGSTATSYCWMVWEYGHLGGDPAYRWIPPCRRSLERPGDYDLPYLNERSAP